MTNFDAAIPNFDKVDQLLKVHGSEAENGDKEITENALDLLITFMKKRPAR